jgi:hypothetical protein
MAVFAELDPGGWLQLITCGHPPPLLLAADGGLRALSPHAYATPLGLHPDMQPSTFTVHTGDRLLFCTDGLLEARDKAGRYFRPEDCLDTLRNPDLQVAADGLLNRLVAHAGRKLDDDVALLLLEIAPPLAGNEQGPVAALAPGSHAVPGHRPLALAGASAVTVRSAHQLGGLERVRGGVPHERRVSWGDIEVEVVDEGDGEAGGGSEAAARRPGDRVHRLDSHVVDGSEVGPRRRRGSRPHRRQHSRC